MQIVKKNINDLIFPDYNPRKKLTPDDKEYQKIKNSIQEYGYADLVIINKDNTIIGGNQRSQVLKDLGYEEIECVQLDLDKTKEKALNIALNKITGEWDYSKLGDLLLELDSENFDLELTGFEDFEIENIMAPIDIDNYGTDFELPEGDKLGIDKMTLYFANEQTEKIEEAIEMIDLDKVEKYGNEHKKGNALYEVVREWLEQKK